MITTLQMWKLWSRGREGLGGLEQGLTGNCTLNPELQSREGPLVESTETFSSSSPKSYSPGPETAALGPGAGWGPNTYCGVLMVKTQALGRAGGHVSSA